MKLHRKRPVAYGKRRTRSDANPNRMPKTCWNRGLSFARPRQSGLAVRRPRVVRYNPAMCGRYTLRRLDLARAAMHALPEPGFEEFTERPRFNVAPSQD